ncbi:retrovirus-related Pol polyprotein from transposon RE1 isoform X1 [Hevea brasiliensis]|uniref:retrovirus-related Pol polyprotein from transposon RE1 isoform X1 n=1 Tax=Hevea brasiliensis TaxID=3981 RepID=UPI0025E50222|nr:retrovirus-related Pol polyprotein from transposon RE1 isoform X1 [Hevea brasiliensis]
MDAGDSSETRVSTNQSMDEIFHLQNSDNPGLVLVSAPLTGTNYLAWSRSMMIALRAKNKLGFINGSTEKPEEDSPTFDKWQRADSMVFSWILNAISKDVVEAFLYVTTAKELWEELKQRFGESNGPLLYQIKREISSFSQDNMSVGVYFTKLKKLWDELSCLRPFPTCTCGAAKTMIDIENGDKVIQFLMGLRDGYDHVRNQVLLMDPLPKINKAYSMVLSVEKQREIHGWITESSENVVLMAKNTFTRKDLMPNKSQKKGDLGKKEDRYCSYCNKSGHLKETCVKLHGYPEWFHELKQKKMNKPQAYMTTQMQDTPFDGDFLTDVPKRSENWANSVEFTTAVQQEVARYMKGKMSTDDNCANYAGFAGLFFT